jgi:hypothetical protein
MPGNPNPGILHNLTGFLCAGKGTLLDISALSSPLHSPWVGEVRSPCLPVRLSKFKKEKK